MKDDKQLEKALQKIGIVAGVGEDWYEIGEAEKDENGETRYGIYAKTEDIAEKVGKVFEQVFARRTNININDSVVTFDMSHHHEAGDDE